MGMTIDECVKELQKLKLPISKHDLSFHFVENIRNEALNTAINTMHAYDRLRIEYEQRLKADMAAMLTEIQLEIEEKSIIDYDEDLYDGGECVISISEINEIIQQKINSLKEA